MSELEKLRNAILEDGVIDENEVLELEKVLYGDGIIDKEEAEFLFELNDAVSGKDNHKSWNKFFVKAICDFVLTDPVSPGEIDADEEAWLRKHIIGDGKIDLLEKELLTALKSKAKIFPSSFNQYL